VNGDMTGGYALVACPADYNVTGKDSFLISYMGTIFRKDLGSDTPGIMAAMTEFDPDSTWTVAE
jgi:hypothetical protein